ncbi:MAG TPA: tetratricopeptide repeat protein, partial [Thermoanaerobaculia bacterium]|nr:tetratricopeptide repeat protein [Thermoanaerobaculia bacterium]
MITEILLLGLLAAQGGRQHSAEFRQRAEEVVTAFEVGDVARLMMLWSERSPSRSADRKRLMRLLDDRAALELSIGDIADERGVVRLELRDKTSRIVLERYELKLTLEDGHPLVWSFASTEADHARQIVDATAEQRAQLLTAIAPSLALTRELLHVGGERLEGGHIEEAISAYTVAADLAERLHDAAVRAAALRGLGQVENMRGETAAAARYFESSLQLAESSGDQRTIAKTLHALATTDRVLGEYARAETRWNTALKIFRETHDRPNEALSLNALGNLRSLLGDYRASKAYFEESLKIHQELNDAVGESIVHNNLGIDERLQGAYREALEHFQRALALSRTVDDVEGISYALGNIGNVLNAQGKYIEA